MPFVLSWLMVALVGHTVWYLLWFSWDPQWELPIRWPSVLVLVLLVLIPVGFHQSDLATPDFDGRHIAFRMWLMAITLLLIQYAFRSQQRLAALQLEKERLQTENYKVQLAALQSKVDPHFLFNSLNTLHALILQNSSESDRFVMSFSNFFRKSLNNNEDTLVELEKELDVLESYLTLMKIRIGDSVAIHMDIDPKWFSYRLPSLGLQTVVENCFKHNSMTESSPLHITIAANPDRSLTVRNNIQPLINPEEKSGMGLELLRKRYALLDMEEGLQISSDADSFQVTLKLLEP